MAADRRGDAVLYDDRGLLQGTLELLILKALSWNEAIPRRLV